MQDNDEKTLSMDDGEKKHYFTRQSRTVVKIDEKGLRKALGAQVYDKFTEPKFVRSKLEEAIEHQVVDPLVVAKYLTTESSDEYITHRKEDQ